MSVYGDPAFPLRIHLQAPFRYGLLTPMMKQYNFDMSCVRVTVEWLFGDLIKDFKFLDFKKNLKIGMSSVGKMYLVCALLTITITCLYGNKTSDFFGSLSLIHCSIILDTYIHKLYFNLDFK